MMEQSLTVCMFWDNCFERLDKAAHHSAQWKAVPVLDGTWKNESCQSSILHDGIW